MWSFSLSLGLLSISHSDSWDNYTTPLVIFSSLNKSQLSISCNLSFLESSNYILFTFCCGAQPAISLTTKGGRAHLHAFGFSAETHLPRWFQCSVQPLRLPHYQLQWSMMENAQRRMSSPCEAPPIASLPSIYSSLPQSLPPGTNRPPPSVHSTHRPSSATFSVILIVIVGTKQFVQTSPPHSQTKSSAKL